MFLIFLAVSGGEGLYIVLCDSEPGTYKGGTRGGRDSLMWILSSGAVIRRRGDPGSWSSVGHSLGFPGGLVAKIPHFHCRQGGVRRGGGGADWGERAWVGEFPHASRYGQEKKNLSAFPP